MVALPCVLPSPDEQRRARQYRDSRVRAATKAAQRDAGQLAARYGHGPGWVHAYVREVTEAARWEQRWLHEQLGVADDWAMLWMGEHRGTDGMARRRRALAHQRDELLAPGSKLRHFTFASAELAVAAIAHATGQAAGLLGAQAVGDPLVAAGVWAGLAGLLAPAELELAQQLRASTPGLAVPQLVTNACAILR